MLFNSYTFLLFFIGFFLLYWYVFNKSLKIQNLLILIGSYIFYAWWDYRFLLLLIVNSLINFLLGQYMYKAVSKKNKDILLYTGVVAGVGVLGYFKYANFFISSFAAALARFHITVNIHSLDIILPLGISFYTFRTLSYLFDIHKNKLQPTSDWVVFFSFVAFFPCLISGPIDRATTLIPQLEKPRDLTYNDAAGAMRQILWGLFKKLVIANSLAQFTDEVFDHYQSFGGSTLVCAALYYTIQLYADFSGYSDMAIGIARLLGFNVTRNFDFPLFAQNIAEFWRKWHISLTKWMTDYVFTPLSISFRDYGALGLIAAIFINFALIGLWHGAKWSYVLFGVLHACYFVPLILNGTVNKKKKTDPARMFPGFKEFINILKTFALVSVGFILFRATGSTPGYVSKIFTASFFTIPEIISKILMVIIILFIAIEWRGRLGQYAIENIGERWPKVYRWAFYYGIVFCLFIFAGSNQTFIYFQF